MFRIFVAVVLALALSACQVIPPLLGADGSNVLTQESKLPYRAAYSIIAKQMRACYREIGLFGYGFDVRSDLDVKAQTGTVEVFWNGIFSESKPEDSLTGRKVIVRPKGRGSIITTIGATPGTAARTHAVIPSWLRGNEQCWPAKLPPEAS